MKSEQGVRARRVSEAVRAHITAALRREMGDRRLADLVVTDVSLPDDLGFARVCVRRLGESTSPRDQAALVAALEKASGRLRKGLGSGLGLRRTPELRFEYDTGPDASARVEELLKEIDAERTGGGKT